MAERTMLEDLRGLEGFDDLVERLLSVLTPDEVLRHYKLEEVLRHYKPDEVLRHLLRDLAPVERAVIEGALPAGVLEALCKYVDRVP